MLQPHLHVTLLPSKCAVDRSKVGGECDDCMQAWGAHECGVSELDQERWRRWRDGDLGGLMADKDVQMMSSTGKHIRSECGGSWGVVWRFWSDLLEGGHSECC